MSQPKRVAFQKFLNAMRKLSTEVNDSEICKRLEILMATSKDDLPLALVNQLLQDAKNFDPKAIPEPYTQYVRHFIYMVKRNGRVPSDFISGEEDRRSDSAGSKSPRKQSLSQSSKSKRSQAKSIPPVKKAKPSAKQSSKKA
ncbi:hypothetical protein ND861_08795 [Leptospira sp. 2 VSF19]|uniref:Uncharacterized protein n=1 Tax=Leptospira soteropolitanensis TaxID=2950025 RepID=A0AAW5VGY7_9LEPT|nr:hypothetical protein [Leptospira soteropolitanensis]MCW7492701.1 hypothetical protein [Leptospira soteropolitanensis]MCW7500384.1 hypothetical protein [Leptospira soteropolitanensis]MCW7522581.1 hypothetical protein [Leptospira soteropolitanensis]MCW7526437.1 hypothetical protein [Leptospira soteropolitanensis]MCW7530354.1 hypothetical protein [Leptospira soteropolitanensis]